MSLQGSLLVVAENTRAGLLAALGAGGAFPVLATRADQAADAIAAARPTAILLADPETAGNERLALLLPRPLPGKCRLFR